MFEINGHTKQLGIIGNPVEHSFSPKMHNYISELMGNNYVYSAWRVEDVENAIKGMRALGIRGMNVTAPHKITVMQYLDEIDETAQLLGSVNTVVNNNGILKGYNTDGEGFYQSMLKAGMEVEGKRLLIIGAGGVTEPTALRLIKAKPKALTILNRTPQKVIPLKERIFNKTGFTIGTEISEFDIIINTTSAGMEPQLDVLPTDMIDGMKSLDFINENTAVVDMIYNPEETLFLKEARLRGAKTLNGLGMLIYQGLLAYELFTETKLPDDIYDHIKREVFGR